MESDAELATVSEEVDLVDVSEQEDDHSQLTRCNDNLDYDLIDPVPDVSVFDLEQQLEKTK